MRTNQTQFLEINGQSLSALVFGRSVEMNIKLVRNAMFITVVIMVISVMGKTSAHEARSIQTMFDRENITQLVLER
jgi:hypothetical protein